MYAMSSSIYLRMANSRSSKTQLSWFLLYSFQKNENHYERGRFHLINVAGVLNGRTTQGLTKIDPSFLLAILTTT